MEPKRALNIKNDLEKEEQRWGPHIFWIQNILQSYSDETGVIWHKDKHRPSEKNREKYTHIYGEMD